MIIITNYVKVRIDKTQQNRCRLCGDGDEMVNHTISECNKLAQKENKTRHDWVGKVINWELFQKFKFDHTNKWHMHNPESVLENKTYKILRDFAIQTDHLISARRPDLVIVKKQNKTKQKNKKTKKKNKKEKRTCRTVEFAVPVEQRVQLKESEKTDRYLHLGREMEKKTMDMKVTVIPVVLGTISKG